MCYVAAAQITKELKPVCIAREHEALRLARQLILKQQRPASAVSDFGTDSGIWGLAQYKVLFRRFLSFYSLVVVARPLGSQISGRASRFKSDRLADSLAGH